MAPSWEAGLNIERLEAGQQGKELQKAPEAPTGSGKVCTGGSWDGETATDPADVPE